MTFSFVIPTYNNKLLLRNTLQALNAQEGTAEFEVVVVDDGSTDGTHELIQDTPRRYPLKVLPQRREPQSCRARTRNRGWQGASGEVIAFIDSDILVRPDHLRELQRCFALGDRMAVIGTRLMLNEPVAPEEVASLEVFRKYRFERGSELLELRHRIYQHASFNLNAQAYPWTQFYSCNVAVPRRWLEATGGFDEEFKGWGVEDIELGYALQRSGVSLVVNHRLEGLHQYHGPRNDLAIKPELMPEYERNAAYFLRKHPEALDMPEECKLPFLKGELADDPRFRDPPTRYLGVALRCRGQLAHVKDLLSRSIRRKDPVIVVDDYVEDTDLDIWMQLPQERGKIVARYFPMSKKGGVPVPGPSRSAS